LALILGDMVLITSRRSATNALGLTVTATMQIKAIRTMERMYTHINIHDSDDEGGRGQNQAGRSGCYNTEVSSFFMST